MIKIPDLPLGKVISLNGRKFVKVNNDPVKGSLFTALEKVCFPNQFDGINMQEFTTNDCNCLPTPTSTNYTLAGVMIDERDGKSYEIRKFADGKCWMVDNLRYGGTTDACVNKSTFSAYGSASPTDRFGTGTYGDCRDAAAGNIARSPCYNSTICGYYYSWQATLQHPSAHNNSFYTGPTSNIQGICPAGWHVPSGDYAAGEFQTLHAAAGSPATGFWQPGGSWKGVESEFCIDYGDLRFYGGAFYWLPGQKQSHAADFASIRSAGLTIDARTLGAGHSVRCIKNL